MANSTRLYFIITLAAIVAPGGAGAQATLDPYSSASFEHDSNIHRLPNSQASLEFYGDPTLDDDVTHFIAGLNGTYRWDLQSLTGTLEARRIDYNHFTDLDHFEYLADAQLKWTLSRLIDGALQFRQEHLAAPFAADQSTTLEVNTDRNVVGKLNLNFNPDWRLATALSYHLLDAPLQDYPNFVERETGTHLGLDYLGLTNLTYGIALDRIAGAFDYAPNAGPYSQTSAFLNVTDVVSGLTTLNGAVGYTRRIQSGVEDSVSGVTGQIKYSRQLTGKTSFTFEALRGINSYPSAGGSETDTSASLALTWAATYRLTVNGGYTYIRSTFTGQAVPGSTANGRLDHSPYESLNVTYQLLKRLQIKAYYSGQSRSSNFDLYTYGDTIFGIQALWCLGGEGYGVKACTR